MPRSLAVLLACGILLLSSLALASTAAAATIAPTTTCNNAFGNGGAVCEITVVNTITATGGTATVTVHECQGSAGVPDVGCTDATEHPYRTGHGGQPVQRLGQRRWRMSLCSVTVTNNFVEISPWL